MRHTRGGSPYPTPTSEQPPLQRAIPISFNTQISKLCSASAPATFPLSSPFREMGYMSGEVFIPLSILDDFS